MGGGKGYFTNYPKHVGFILGNEFCERFSFYGMKAILVIFLTRALKLSDDKSTEIYHGFNMACYFTPLLGALLADGFLGQYKTIFSISIVYAIGNVIMAVGAIPFNGEDYISALPFVGLTLIAIGTGGIKPCVAAFGADQFEDNQVRQKETFFSLFYMSINIGSLMSMILTPLIRSNVNCFGDECYALAFGIPAILMVTSLILFVIGTRWYTINPPGDNVLGNLFGCLFVALKGKFSCSKNEGPREHWLDYADSKYDKSFIADVKAVMHVLFIFLPFPMFNALYDQQGSRWILQAGRLDGVFGGFVLEPDLIQVANPIMVVILVPFMESVFFPCMDKLKIPNSPLQRMGIGMFLAGVAFIVSGLLQLAIDKELPKSIPPGFARFKILNAVPCDITGSVLDENNMAVHNFTTAFNDRSSLTSIPTLEMKEGNYTFEVQSHQCLNDKSVTIDLKETFPMLDQGSYNMIVYWDMSSMTPAIVQAKQSIMRRTDNGQASVQFFNTWDAPERIEVEFVDDPVDVLPRRGSSTVEVPHGKVKFKFDNMTVDRDPIHTYAGAAYTLVLHYGAIDGGKPTYTQYQDITPNSVNILFMLPQYFVMTVAEVFVMVSGLSFAYSQSPPSMKAVLQASWLLTTSFGNLIVMIITAIGSLPNQMAEFFMYAGLMFLTTFVYVIMAMSYEYVSYSDVEPSDDSDTSSDMKKEKFADDGDGSDKLGFDNLAMEAIDIPPKYDSVVDDNPDSFTTVHF